MSTIEEDIAADDQAVIDHAMGRQPLDPEIARRIQERAARITEEIRRQHGVQELAVELIRHARDEA
jgi:hypothetical protein